MVNSLIANITGFLGLICSDIYYLSPYSMFKQIEQNKDWIKIPYIMLIFNALNSGLFIIYGLSGAGAQVWICHTIGHLFTQVFLIKYISYRFETNSNIKLCLSSFSIICALLFVGIGLTCVFTSDTEFIKNCYSKSGGIVLVVNILMFMSPAQNLVSVANN